jgi:DNA-binding transcriptional LysR family regulator
VALFPSGARMMLAGLLDRARAVPEIDLQCRDVDLTPANVLAMSGDFDIVVGHRDEAMSSPYADERLVVPLLREPLDVALPPRHPLARHRRLRLEQLADQPWISVEVGWPVDDVLRSIELRTGTSARVVHRINDFSVTEELVAAGHGIALLPRFSTDDRGGRRLHRRPLAGVRAARLVEAVLRPSVAERPAVQTVLDALRAEAAAVVARG